MIVVRVELWSARTGKKTELARMHIANVGNDLCGAKRWNYLVQAMRKPAWRAVTRWAQVRNYPSDAVHVWNLVARALAELYPQNASSPTGGAAQGPAAGGVAESHRCSVCEELTISE